MRNIKMVTSMFICTECGTKIPLARYLGKQRKHNHIKDIWCYNCKSTMKFREIKYNEF